MYIFKAYETSLSKPIGRTDCTLIPLAYNKLSTVFGCYCNLSLGCVCGKPFAVSPKQDIKLRTSLYLQVVAKNRAYAV